MPGPVICRCMGCSPFSRMLSRVTSHPYSWPPHTPFPNWLVLSHLVIAPPPPTPPGAAFAPSRRVPLPALRHVWPHVRGGGRQAVCLSCPGRRPCALPRACSP